MRIFGKGKCKFIAKFSATMVTSLPSLSLSLSVCISLSLSLSLSLSHRKYLTHNIGSASALPIIRTLGEMHGNRGLFQRLSGNEVRGIAGEKRLRCVCFSFDMSSLFEILILESQPSIPVECCVPRFFNGRRTSPSLSYHSFPLSSELRKHWLVALRRYEGANSRVSESTVLCSERFLRKIFTFFLVPKSLWTLPLPIMAKQGKASRFLKADAVLVQPVFFFFCARKWKCLVHSCGLLAFLTPFVFHLLHRLVTCRPFSVKLSPSGTGCLLLSSLLRLSLPFDQQFDATLSLICSPMVYLSYFLSFLRRLPHFYLYFFFVYVPTPLLFLVFFVCVLLFHFPEERPPISFMLPANPL